MNRYGLAGHLEPWDVIDPTEINFLAELRHLHDANYNILTYDLRNLGRSGTGNNGACGVGRYEWRDCVGAQKFVASHPELSKMTIGLLSRCTGGNAQYEAISRHPELFEDVKCMVSPLVVSMEAFTRNYANSVLEGAGDFPEILDFEQVRTYMAKDIVEIVPLAFMRGRTLANTFMILDEAQNTTVTQMKMFLTRMGEGSRIVVTGDSTQVDLPDNMKSGLADAVRRLQHVEGVESLELDGRDIVRHRLVREIVAAYDDRERGGVKRRAR